MADYIEGKRIDDRLYMNTNPLYMDTSVPEGDDGYHDIPSEFSAVMSNLIREANGEDENFLVKDRELLDAYNKSLDDLTEQQANSFINESVVALAERGVSANKAVEWANNQKQMLYPAKNSGAYTQVKDKRLLAAAEEDTVIKSLLIGGSPEEIEVAKNLDKMQTGLANYEIVYNKMVEANNAYDEQGILTKLGKGLVSGGAVPFIDNINAARISSKLQSVFGEGFGTNVNVNTLYEKTRENLLAAASTMNENEFKDLVNTIDEQLLSTTALTFGDRSAFWSNVYDQNYRLNNTILGTTIAGTAISGLGAVAAASGKGVGTATKAFATAALHEALPGSQIAAMSLAKIAKSPVKYFTLKGQRKLAARLAYEDLAKNALMDIDTLSEKFNMAGRAALENTGSGLSKPFIADAALDISKTPIAKRTMAMITSDAAQDVGLQDSVELVRRIKEADVLGQIVRDTENEAKQKFVSEFLSNAKANRQYIQTVSSENSKDGFTTILELGRGDKNMGFASKADAQEFIKNLNITSDDFLNYKVIDTKPSIVQRADGYFVQLKRTYQMADGDMATIGDMAGSKIKAEFAKGVRSEYSSNPVFQNIASNNVIPHYIRTINNAYQAAEGRTLYLLQDYLKTIKKGSGPVFDKLMDLTRSKGTWIEPKYLAERGVPENIIKAYHSMRVVEDASRMLDGQVILKDLKELGMKNVYSNGKRLGLGKVATGYEAKNVNLLVDVDKETGELVTRGIKNSDELKNGVTVYEMQRSVNGSRYIAINNNTLAETEPTWSNTFLSYKPGRKTFSRGSGFIKQVQIGKTSGGEKFLNGVNTIFSHPNQESVKRATGLLEQARKIAIRVSNKEITIDEAESLFRQLPDRDILKFDDFSSFYKNCGEGKLISLNPEAELLYVPDGGKLPDYVAGLNVKDHNRAGISMLDFSNSEYVIEKTMRKADDVLNPFTLTQAPRVSVDEELALEVKRILNSSNVSEYTRLFADDFADTFKQFIGNRDPVEALMDRTWVSSVKDNKARWMITNAQDTFARMKSQPTKFDNFVEGTATWVANWLAPGWKAPEGSNRLALYRSLTKASPTKMLRAYGFHFNLGMWNPRQLYAQAAASVNAMEMSPKAAAKITPMYMPLIGYMKSGDKSLLARIAKSFGVKQDYIDELVEGTKRLDIWSKGSFGGAYDIAERGKGFWDNFSSTWFYDSGEHINRMYTGLLTTQEYLDKGISVSKMSKEQLLQAINRQQNLYLNMSRAGTSEIQRGALGVLTQFRGYQMRAVELMFDKTLTAAEKRRFMLSTLVLGGTKGAIGRKGAAMIHSYMEDKFNIPEYASQVVYNGALDQYMVENGHRVSLGEFFNVSFGDLLDLAVETNPPSYSAIGKTVGAVGTLFNGIARYGRDGESTPKAYIAALNIFADMARKGQLPGGFKNAILGTWAYHTGERLNAKGMLVDKDLDAIDSAFISIGLRNPMRDIEALAYEKLSQTKDKEAEMAASIQEMLLMAKRAPNQQMADAYMSAMHTLLSDINEENPIFVRNVLREAFNPRILGDFNTDSTMRAARALFRATGTDYGLYDLEKELEQSKERTKE